MPLKRIKPITLTVYLIVALVFVFSRCINNATFQSTDARGPAYAGSKSCVNCHKNIAGSYSHTAHFRTSQPARELPGNWLPGKRFVFNDSVQVSVEKTDSGLYQIEYIHDKAVLAKPFHLAIGSGDDAVSFGYWLNKKIYQLPLTYFEAIHGWANSPGFPVAEPYFNRPILVRCFECHGSFAKTSMQETEGLSSIRNIDSASVIYGIDCERCHGPAADHVRFHQENPSAKTAQYISKWNSLSRQQKLDACAVCHSGNDVALQNSTFGFKPGDTLANYYFPFSSGSAEADVHGKQMQLLASSRCFQLSKTMECTTCHSPHEAAPKNTVLESASCINCHRRGPHLDCRVADSLPATLQANCIDCHMPLMASKKINIQAQTDQSQAYFLRTHRIAVYPEESKKFLRQKGKSL